MELCVTSEISSRLPDRTPVPFADRAALARAVGFTAMDYGITAAAMSKSGAIENALTEQRIAADAGIVFRYVHLPYSYPKEADGWAAFDAATRRAMELAVQLGVECAAIHPRTFMTQDYDPAALREETLAFLAPYAEYAHSIGLTLALENMRGAGRRADPAIRRYMTDVRDVLDIAEALDIGVCYDTGHGNISAQDAYTSLVLLAPRLKMLHVNDNLAEDDIHLAPYLGNTNWAGVTQALREIGFRGAINLEVTCNRLPAALRERYAAYMGESARQLRDAISA